MHFLDRIFWVISSLPLLGVCVVWGRGLRVRHRYSRRQYTWMMWARMKSLISEVRSGGLTEVSILFCEWKSCCTLRNVCVVGARRWIIVWVVVQTCVSTCLFKREMIDLGFIPRNSTSRSIFPTKSHPSIYPRCVRGRLPEHHGWSYRWLVPDDCFHKRSQACEDTHRDDHLARHPLETTFPALSRTLVSVSL